MKHIGIILLISLLLTGCWDKEDLDRRDLLLGAAIDSAPQDSAATGNKPYDENESNMYMLTLEIPSYLKKGAEGEASQGSQKKGKAVLLYKDVGPSFYEIINKTDIDSERALFLGQTRVLIIGEELARKQELSKTLDFWSRNREVNKALKVMFAHGNASEIFNADPKNSRSISTFLKNQLEQSGRESMFINTDLTSLLSILAEGGNGLVSNINFSSDDNLTVSGSAVLKEGKLTGWLDRNETQMAKFITGKAKAGEVSVEDPEYKGSFITVSITDVKTHLYINTEGKIPSFNINIKIGCKIIEISNVPRILNEKVLDKAQDAVSNAVKKQIREVIEKLQHQYKVDALGFGSKLEKYKNKEWKKVKQEWDEIYPQIPISVEVKTLAK